MNLATAFTESARKCAGKPAIFWGEDVVTYDEIAAESRWLAHELTANASIKPGDRVAVWLKNCPQFVSVVFGILQSGAVVVPINNFLKPDEVSFILRDCGAKILISEEGMREGTARLRTGAAAAAMHVRLCVVQVRRRREIVSGTSAVSPRRRRRVRKLRILKKEGQYREKAGHGKAVGKDKYFAKTTDINR